MVFWDLLVHCNKVDYFLVLVHFTVMVFSLCLVHFGSLNSCSLLVHLTEMVYILLLVHCFSMGCSKDMVHCHPLDSWIRWFTLRLWILLVMPGSLKHVGLLQICGSLSRRGLSRT